MKKDFMKTVVVFAALAVLLINPHPLRAQNSPPVIVQPSADRNYIMTFTIRDTNIVNPDANNLPAVTMLRTVQYFDGLGRPLQTIQVKGNADGTKDLVIPVEYDKYGRQNNQFLPYVTTSGPTGSYHIGALNSGGIYNESDQKVFYNPQASQNYAPISSPYAATVFEPSPLNRLDKQGAPGDTWQPGIRNSTGGRTVVIAYGLNNTKELADTANTMLVALFRPTVTPTRIATLTRATGDAGQYSANQLYVTIVKDENWMSGRGGTVEEYKDKQGRVVLKRTFNWISAVSKLEILSTYYIYDDRGNLMFVLPPKAEADGAANISQSVLDNLCYQYRYDERGRMTEKKLPGKGWEYMVYNTLDQVTFTQDALQRSKPNQEWTFIRYDAIGRPVITGIWLSGDPADNTISAPSTSRLEYLFGWSRDHTPFWANRDNSTTTGYNTDNPPGQLLTISYFDNYTIPGLPAAYSLPTGAVANPKGLQTATKTAVLNSDGTISNDMLWTVFYYDDRGRNIKTFSQHYQNATISDANYDEFRVGYNFAGDVIKTIRRHFTVASGSSTPALNVIDSVTYDHLGRKLTNTQQTASGSTAGPPVMISKVDYNDIGQVYQKRLHSEDSGSNFLQTIAYQYNERGWLIKINNPLITQPVDRSKLFSLELKYNLGSVPQYNGNISNQVFANTGSTGAEPVQTFSYKYDQLNRLTSGISTGAVPPTTNMSETNISYDKMGNISSLTRDGSIYGYDYNYNSFNGNLLNNVSGLTTGNYHYDKNGNMDTDARNGTAISYNLLNLPMTVTKTGLNIAYYYTATGQKLRKASNLYGANDYINGIQYTNNSAAVDFIQTEEGRAVRLTDGTFKYNYDLKDQLGNVRLTFQKSATDGKADRLQSDNYYAFGLRKTINNIPSVTNKYLYNGKEIQDETGDYDYGARHYDPVIARWTAVDPLAEKSRRWSVYNYAMSNPVRFVDPDGMEVKDYNKEFEANLHRLLNDAAAAMKGADGLSDEEWTASNRTSNFNDAKIDDSEVSDDSQEETEQTDNGDNDDKKSKAHQQELETYGQITNGYAASISFSFIGGGTLEYGYVVTDKNFIQYYTTWYGSNGFSAPSLSGTLFKIISTNSKNKPTLSDWAGAATNLSAGGALYQGSVGYGSNYMTIGGGISIGLKKTGKWTLYPGRSGTFNAGETTLRGKPFWTEVTPAQIPKYLLFRYINMYKPYTPKFVP